MVYIAVGSSDISCLWKVTLPVNDIKVEDSVHVGGLNETLLSVEHIFDQGKIVRFTSKESVVLNVKISTANEDDIEVVTQQSKFTALSD